MSTPEAPGSESSGGGPSPRPGPRCPRLFPSRYLPLRPFPGHHRTFPEHRAFGSSFSRLEAKAASEAPAGPDPGEIQAPGKWERFPDAQGKPAAVQLEDFLVTKLHRLGA